MKRVLTLLCLSILIFNSFAFAEDLTCIDLLKATNSAVKQSHGEEISVEESIQMFYWMGYITGFNDASIITHVGGSNPLFTLPDDGIEAEDAMVIYRKYVRVHPELVGESARVCLVKALNEAFPVEK